MTAHKNGQRPDFKVYTITDSYFEFLNKDNKIPVKTKNKVSFEIYKKIISKFLFIYVNEVLFLNKTYYFPLTGKIMLNKCGGWIRRDESNHRVGSTNSIKKTSSSVGFFWYDRPIGSMFFTKIKKMTGSSNILPVLEKEFKKTFNIEKLKFSKELKEIHKIVDIKKTKKYAEQ